MELKRSFYPNIEGYRGLSVLLVLISHWIIISYFPDLIFLKLGFLGVNFFFVLSGFLITEILIIDLHNNKSKSSIVKNFFAKRVLRIFPIFYIVMLLMTLFNVENTAKLWPWLFTYSLNIAENWFIEPNKIFMHIWSLCVEEQFYIIWPFVIITVFKKKLFKTILFFIVISIVFKLIISLLQVENSNSINHSNIFAAMDALSIGGLLAYLKCYRSKTFKFIGSLSQFYIIIMLLLLWGLSYFEEHLIFINHTFLRSLAGVIGGLIIVKSVNNQRFFLKWMVESKIMKFIGKISYGVYLYHWIISFLLVNIFNSLWDDLDLKNLGFLSILHYHRYLGAFLFYSLITIGLAYISFVFIEKPILKLKRFFN